MEVSGFVKPLFGSLLSLAFLYLLVLRPWRPRLFLAGLSPSLDLLFLATLVLAASALLEPRPFDRGAALLIAQTDLPDTIAEVDTRISDLEALPERLWADLKASIGFGDDEIAPPPPVLVRPGSVEATVIQAVGEIVSMILRVYTYLSCVLALWVLLVVRLFSRSRASHPGQRQREEDLEHRVATLEASLARALGPDPLAGRSAHEV